MRRDISSKESFFRTVLTLVAMTVAAIFSIFIAEIFFRYIFPLPPFRTTIPLRPNVKLILETDLRGVSSNGSYSTNSWGFRGDEAPMNRDEYLTIITIGGSTTQCFYLDDHKTWPWLLQQYLKESGITRVWVGNGGIDGQTTRAHIRFMEEIIPVIKPKVVIVMAGINDLGLALKGYPNFLLESPHDKRGTAALDWVYSRSSLIRFLYVWKSIIIDKAPVVKQAHRSSKPKPLASKDEKCPTIPQRPLDQYEQNITTIIGRAREAGVRLIFLTQPLLYDDSDYWRGYEGMYTGFSTTYPISAACLRRYLNVYNEMLVSVCRHYDCEYLELHKIMPCSDDFFYDACHFTEAGADFVARQCLRFF